MAPDDEPLRIGRFARLCGVPASALRYYHAQGVLVPASIDPSTGYRLYDRSQLETALLVRDLRAAGVGVRAIASVASGTADPLVVIDRERDRLEAEIRANSNAIVLLETVRTRLRSSSEHACTIRTRARHAVAAVTGAIPRQEPAPALRRLVADLRRRLRPHGLLGNASFGALFPDGFEVEPIPTAVFASIAHPVPSRRFATELPAGRYAVTTHVGNHAVEPAYDSLRRYIADRRLEPAGAVIEEYAGSRDAPVTTISVAVAS